MTMDQEARALMAQLVAALVPPERHAFTREDEARPVTHRQPRAVTLGALRAAGAAAGAGKAALAVTAG